MLLIASERVPLAQRWHSALEQSYDLYQPDAKDIRTLEICLKKVAFEAIIIDVPLLGENGVNKISAFLEIQPDVKLILMDDIKQDEQELSAILLGAKAFCLSSLPNATFLKMVQTVLAGEIWVQRNFLSRLLAEFQDMTRARHKEALELEAGMEAMTPRESEIAALVATGDSNRKIAEKLSISERTVKAHLGVIFRKIGITDRLQLALYINRHQQLTGIWSHRGSH